MSIQFVSARVARRLPTQKDRERWERLGVVPSTRLVTSPEPLRGGSAQEQAASGEESAAPQKVPPEKKDFIFVTSEAYPVAPPTTPSVHQIIKQIAAEHNVSLDEILGPRRQPPLVAARHAAMAAVYLAKPHLSLPVLGRYFHRDHTSLLSALRKMGVYQPRNRPEARQ